MKRFIGRAVAAVLLSSGACVESRGAPKPLTRKTTRRTTGTAVADAIATTGDDAIAGGSLPRESAGRVPIWRAEARAKCHKIFAFERLFARVRG